MADITAELNAIANAAYGREVRGSIGDALLAMNTHVNTFDGNVFQNMHTVITNSNKADICNGDLDYLPDNKLYKISYAASIEHNPFPGKYALVFGMARTSGTYAQGDCQVAVSHGVISIRSRGASDWDEWIEGPNDDVLVSLDTTIMSSTRAASLGYSTIEDLPPNHTYRFDTSLGDDFGLPAENTGGATAIIFRPAGETSSSSRTIFYWFLMNGKVYYRSNVYTTWRSFVMLEPTEEVFKAYTTTITSAIAEHNGWTSVYDLPAMYSYRLANSLDNFDLPTTNTAGAGVWVYRTSGNNGPGITSATATFYLVAMGGTLYYGYKTGRTRSPWMDLANGGGGGSGLPTRSYVAFGASTVTAASAGNKYPYYVGKMGNFATTNLAVGGTDFISRTSGYDNVMDLLTNGENAAILKDADLITINVGANDYTMYVKSRFAANPDYEHTYIGQPYDYYPYNKNSRPTEASLRDNCTKAGAANFIIKYCADNYPKAQLMFIISPPSVGQTRQANADYQAYTYTLSDSGTTETLTKKKVVKVTLMDGREMLYADNPHAKGWYERTSSTVFSVSTDTVADKTKRYYTRTGTSPDYTYTEIVDVEYGKCYVELVNDMMRKLCKRAKVPLIDCTDMFTSAFYDASADRENPSKYRDDRDDHPGVHPTVAAYEQYSKAVAAAILAKYRN